MTKEDLNSTKNGSKGKNPGQTKKNPAGGMDVCLFVSVVCCQMEVPASG
jgi:hypothetical protein